MLNMPANAVATRKNFGNNKDGADLTDSEFDGNKQASDAFKLNSFSGDGPAGHIDLGVKLPDDIEVFVWEDGKSHCSRDGLKCVHCL